MSNTDGDTVGLGIGQGASVCQYVVWRRDVVIEMTRRGLPRSRLRLLIAFVAAGLLLSGCPNTTDPMSCNCPNLLDTATSIDWTGDGTAPSSVNSYPGGTLPHQAVLNYDVADAAAIASAQQQVEDRLKSFPAVFQARADRQGSVEFVGADWIVYVGGVILEDRTSMTVFVYIDEDDRAAEILEPIADVLGIIATNAG